MTALIADDSNILRYTIKEMLKNTGFTTFFEASNGADALSKFKEFSPDIITLDVSMDKMDGIDVLKNIMKLDPNAKVIMISSISQDIVIKDAIKTGAGEYIIKPFSQDQISNAVNRLLN